MGRFAALLAASAIALSTLPASAQPGNDWGGRPPTAYVDGLQWQIDTAAKDGRISWRQHRWLQRDLDEAKPLAWKVQTNTATPGERRRLNFYVGEIEHTIHGGDYRGYYRGDGQDWRH